MPFAACGELVQERGAVMQAAAIALAASKLQALDTAKRSGQLTLDYEQSVASAQLRSVLGASMASTIVVLKTAAPCGCQC
jgi:NAD(P)H-nitrite reductase large subunit